METGLHNTASVKLVGPSAWARRTRAAIVAQAAKDAPLLVFGPAGSGKSLVARAVHNASARTAKRFVVMDCAASGGINDGDSWLAAEGGTVYLEEVASLDRRAQAALVEILGEGADVRLIASTRQDLATEVMAGRFLAKLHDVLSAESIATEPLADREDDIPALADHILAACGVAAQMPAKRLSRRALAKLCGAAWRGNVDELQNVLERAVVFARGELIAAEDLYLPEGDDVLAFPQAAARSVSPVDVGAWPTLSEIECEHIRHTLAHVGGDEVTAAQLLDMDLCQFQQRVMRYGLRACGSMRCTGMARSDTRRKAA
jgi:DNA-binding NtrC family response regulator